MRPRRGYRGLVLVKPQFEAGREQVGKGGVVRDPAVHLRGARRRRGVARSSAARRCSASATPAIPGQRGTWSTSSISAMRASRSPPRAPTPRDSGGARCRGGPWLSRCAASPCSPHHLPRTTTAARSRELADEGRPPRPRARGARRRSRQAPRSPTALGYRVVDDDELRAADLCLVLGGDGTILRALGRLLGSGVPTTGVNFGNVGFLAAHAAQTAGAPGSSASLGGSYTRRRAAHRRGTLERRAPHGGQRHRARPGRARSASLRLVYEVAGDTRRRDALRRHDRRLAGRLDRLQPLVRRAARGVGRRRARAQLHRPALARASGRSSCAPTTSSACATPRPPTRPRSLVDGRASAACAAARGRASPPAPPRARLLVQRGRLVLPQRRGEALQPRAPCLSDARRHRRPCSLSSRSTISCSSPAPARARAGPQRHHRRDRRRQDAAGPGHRPAAWARRARRAWCARAPSRRSSRRSSTTTTRRSRWRGAAAARRPLAGATSTGC